MINSLRIVSLAALVLIASGCTKPSSSLREKAELNYGIAMATMGYAFHRAYTAGDTNFTLEFTTNMVIKINNESK